MQYSTVTHAGAHATVLCEVYKGALQGPAVQ